MATDQLKVIPLPDYDNMRQRLISFGNEPHLVERFYPLLLQHAGEDKNGPGIVMMFVLAIADYTAGMPAAIVTVLYMRLPKLVAAIVDDEEVRSDALEMMRTTGIA